MQQSKKLEQKKLKAKTILIENYIFKVFFMFLKLLKLN